jgi:hypothetical protein
MSYFHFKPDIIFLTFETPISHFLIRHFLMLKRTYHLKKYFLWITICGTVHIKWTFTNLHTVISLLRERVHCRIWRTKIICRALHILGRCMLMMVSLWRRLQACYSTSTSSTVLIMSINIWVNALSWSFYMRLLFDMMNIRGIYCLSIWKLLILSIWNWNSHTSLSCINRLMMWSCLWSILISWRFAWSIIWLRLIRSSLILS